jgi:hypothetical protein
MKEKSIPVEVDHPIFIVGPHRSGTTLLYNMLSRHPDVGYFNIANRRFPSFPLLAHIITYFGMPDQPMESQPIWDRFWNCEHDEMGANDASPEAVSWYRKTVKRVLQLRNAKRFLAKYPRLTLRLDWIDAVFPGALFVHIIRDWRAVVNSTLVRRHQRESKGGGWYGDRIPGWKEMGDLPPEIVAGRQYHYLTKTLESKETNYPGRFIKVYYTKLCKYPVETIRYIADKCDLSWTEDFEKGIRRDLQSMNYKWRTQLDPSKIEKVRAENPEFFSRHEESD